MTNLEKTILDTIAYFEGTIGKSANGYDVLFGGKKVMNGWDVKTTTIRHRCIYSKNGFPVSEITAAGFKECEDKTWEEKFTNKVTGKESSSTAAGRYQFIGSSWFSATKNALGKNNINAPMSKENQDKCALYNVKTKKKVTDNDLQNGLKSFDGFKNLMKKLGNEWESFKRSLNDTDYKIQPNVGWEFYKGAHQKYETKNTTGTQNN